MSDNINPTKTLNCTGLSCPMPLINLKMKMAEISSGDILEVVSDDPGFCNDMPAWAESTGSVLISIRKEGSITRCYVKKK